MRFREYRDYETRRIEASDALMALLAGAQLASHLLKLNEGSDRLLPEVFPKVPHIRRFNLTSEKARAILDTADEHLGAMSVPYALAIHEDFLKTCLGLLETAGRLAVGKAEDSKLATQHELIEKATHGQFCADNMQMITTLRRMRNCTIHSGGRANAILVKGISGWTAEVEREWIRLAGRNPRHLRVGDVVRFSHGELILALAVTKRLGREANQLLQPALSRDLWADIVVADLLTDDGGAILRSEFPRKVQGWCRFSYGALSLSRDELDAAVARARLRPS
ncbi:hypothetical protein [uncultured Friedmanniella sp.]|uniref:hypothetical protein n=1 Tax=uncultured Friedmanniella sp. TaxID=335381 RepID=UPI0035CAE30B